MPKRIVILDPNGVEVANKTVRVGKLSHQTPMWRLIAEDALDDLSDALVRENPKLGTYTVTVKEVGDD